MSVKACLEGCSPQRHREMGPGMDGSGPVSVTASGTKPSTKPDWYNCHPHFAVTYTYANGTHLVTSSDGENGNRFIGDNGWIFVNTRKRPICDVEVGYRSVTVCHLGAIALRLGIPLDWDPKAERFVGPRADKGNAMISRERRSPWRLDV
jgi:hypothetical protein